MFGVFGLLGLWLAAFGIYGVMAYMVVQRTNEIGIRMALGARPSDVVRLVVGQGARLALAGIGLGVAAGLALSRLIAGLLFRIGAQDPVTFSLVAATLGQQLWLRRGFLRWVPRGSTRYAPYGRSNLCQDPTGQHFRSKGRFWMVRDTATWPRKGQVPQKFGATPTRND